MSELTQMSFDYGSFSDNERLELQMTAARIRAIIDIATMEVGKELVFARDKFRHKDGGFKEWVELEAGISRSVAYELISIYEGFSSVRHGGHLNMARKAQLLYLKESTPQEAKDEVIQRAQSGEHITKKAMEDAIKRAKTEAEQRIKQAEDKVAQLELSVQNAEHAKGQALNKAQEADRTIANLNTTISNIKNQLEASQKLMEESDEQIAELERKISDIQKPEVQIVEKDSEETLKKMETLQNKLKFMKKSRDDNAEAIKKLTEMLNEKRILDERAKQEFEIRNKWRNDTREAAKTLEALYLAIPSSIDLQSFDPTDLDILARVIRLAQEVVDKGQQAITTVHAVDQGFIDAEARVY